MSSPEEQPEIPAELWMLWIPSIREWVISTSDGPTCLVAFTEADARTAAEHQNHNYVLQCHPVRVK